MKAASAWGIHWTWNITGENYPFSLDVGIGFRNCLEERLRVRMKLTPEEILLWCEFDDLPEIHDGDSVAHVFDNAQVVGDEQVC